MEHSGFDVSIGVGQFLFRGTPSNSALFSYNNLCRTIEVEIDIHCIVAIVIYCVYFTVAIIYVFSFHISHDLSFAEKLGAFQL